jgi:hypothetical protein
MLHGEGEGETGRLLGVGTQVGSPTGGTKRVGLPTLAVRYYTTGRLGPLVKEFGTVRKLPGARAQAVSRVFAPLARL